MAMVSSRALIFISECVTLPSGKMRIRSSYKIGNIQANQKSREK